MFERLRRMLNRLRTRRDWWRSRRLTVHLNLKQKEEPHERPHSRTLPRQVGDHPRRTRSRHGQAATQMAFVLGNKERRSNRVLAADLRNPGWLLLRAVKGDGGPVH